MWDVIWTDPDKELVGEHKARKEKEGTHDKSLKSRSGRQSVSTSSSRSSADSPFSIFRSRGPRRVNTSISNAQMASSASSGIESPNMASSSLSPLSKTFDSGSRRSSGRASISFLERLTSIDSPLSTSPIPEKTDAIRGKQPLILSVDGTIFSASPPNHNTIVSPMYDKMTESEKMTHLVQISGPRSTIAKQAEACLLSSEGLSSISDTAATTKASDCPLTPPLSPTEQSLSLASSPTTKPKLVSPVAPRNKLPLAPMAPNSPPPVMPNNPDAWKPVNEWDPIPNDDSPIGNARKPPVACLPAVRNKNGPSSLKDFEVLHAEVSRMASTSAPDNLSRLKELWKGFPKKDVQFLMSYRPEAAEYRRWMLSTMIHMDQVTDPGKILMPRKESPMTARMVLALYDSIATVEYLATLYSTKQIYHLSQSSETHNEQLLNVRVISVSEISPTDFPVAPRLYESVHSLTLPSLCPSSFLPGILKNVYKCLKIGGSLRLILIDPLPRASTMGKHMKTWVEKHLLHNLAKQARCMSPGALFPTLLAEAGLRGKGSTLTTTKFYAIPDSATSRRRDADEDVNTSESEKKVRAEEEAKAQVRSLVGRMLWVEVWGPYVSTNKWWWDDRACAGECLELGTFWEYHVVKGVKGD